VGAQGTSFWLLTCDVARSGSEDAEGFHNSQNTPRRHGKVCGGEGEETRGGSWRKPLTLTLSPLRGAREFCRGAVSSRRLEATPFCLSS